VLSNTATKIFSLKTLKYVIITISAFLLIGVLGYFSLRNYVLQKILTKVKSKIENSTYLTFNAENAKFTSLNTVQLTQISLVPKNKDTLFTTDTVNISVKLLPALMGKIRLSNLRVVNTTLNLRKDSIQTNFRGLLKPSKKQAQQSANNSNYAKKTFTYIKTLLRYLPNAINLNNAKVKLKYNDSFRHITLQNFSFYQSEFSAVVSSQKEAGKDLWLANGFFDKEKIKGKLEIISPDNSSLGFASLFKSGLGFSKIHLTLNKLSYKNNAIQLTGSSKIEGLRIYNAKLSKDTVAFYNVEAILSAQVNKDFITVDSTSVFTFNDIKFNTFAQYPLGKKKQYRLKIKMPFTPAQSFFTALPQGMFSTFKGIKVKGNLSYNLHCFIDGEMPDSLQFQSSLQKENFWVVKFGQTDYTKINRPFTHTVHEKNQPSHSFIVGDTNPHFTPLAAVSPYFVNALLINEDPSFFRHRGFIPQSFRDAIAAVYKADLKFVRGGSTISMQLVKNAFLERRKTIARKAEEALIVWLIESNRLSTKERMFEVYINIIEFAPNVYGIGEAVMFYFDKKPADLTLAEGIYLSNIIPRPKAFKYGFEKDGTMKYWLQEKANLVVRRMVQREILPAADTAQFNPQVQLKGEAKYFIVPADSSFIPYVDTLSQLNNSAYF